jgi:hypothetical protein
MVSYHYDRGRINDLDVSGLTLALIGHIPGNPLHGNWKMSVFVDEKATPEQKEAILAAHTGKLGGPLADLAKLVGEVVGVYDAPIEFDLEQGKGTLRVSPVAYAEMQPYTDSQGRPTKLVDTILSTIPGSPAYIGKASTLQVDVPQHSFQWEFSGRNAVLGEFRLEG